MKAFSTSSLQTTRWTLAAVVATAVCAAVAESDPFVKREPLPLVGRWDLKVRDGEREYPSWLEFEQSGYRTVVGRYVGQFGSVRPIAKVDCDDSGRFHFVIPPQWEHRTNDVIFQGKLDGEVLRGTTANDEGKT